MDSGCSMQSYRNVRSRHTTAFGLSTMLAAACLLAALGAGAMAQDGAKPKSGSPVGGQGWSPDVKADSPVAGIALEPAQLETVAKVSAYFNQLVTLRGSFVQTTPDSKRMRGRFYVKRPGRLRFEYSLPSKQLIVADGQTLQIADLDLNTDDRIALNQTPFRILLKKDVDLIRDSRILEVQEADDLIILALQDKSPDAPGTIRLFLTKTPTLELKEWVTTDAQGTDTRVELANLTKPEDLENNLFVVISPTLRPQK